MSFREIVTLIVIVPLFLFLPVLFPPVCAIFFGLWICCLCLDVHSTRQFYLEEPEKFDNNEQNKIFTHLTKYLGFWKAIGVFVVCVEGLLIVVFAVLALPVLHNFMFSTKLDFWVGVCVGFGVVGVGHLQAALKNTKLNNKK